MLANSCNRITLNNFPLKIKEEMSFLNCYLRHILSFVKLLYFLINLPWQVNINLIYKVGIVCSPPVSGVRNMTSDGGQISWTDQTCCMLLGHRWRRTWAWPRESEERQRSSSLFSRYSGSLSSGSWGLYTGRNSRPREVSSLRRRQREFWIIWKCLIYLICFLASASMLI